MPQVCRQGDQNSAGGVVIAGTIPSVTVNGLPIAVVGSLLSPDSQCDDDNPHCSPVIIQGSSSVTAGGIPVAFVGSANDCGHVMSTGSDNISVSV